MAESHLGELEQLVLLATWRLDGDGWGARIRREIEERGGRRLTISAIYATLVRLEKKGYLSSELRGARPVPGGKAKRYFEVTADGVAALRAERRRLRRMWEGLEASAESAPPERTSG